MAAEMPVEQARAKLGDLVIAAMSGQTTTLTRYGRPVARIVQDGTHLLLAADGPGSRQQIEEYVRTVIEQRTTPNDDTTAERLARNITTSVLSRLGATFTTATRGIVPMEEPTMDITDQDIRDLMQEAGAAGDTEMAAICQRALDGDEAARAECDRTIADARAEAAERG